MTLPRSFVENFVEGMAQLIADTVDGLAWDPAQQYGDDVTGLFIASMPDLPDRCAVLTPYVVAHDPTMSDSELGLQIRSRSAGADVRDAWRLGDSIANQLLGLFPVDLATGVRVNRLTWSSGASLGREPAGKRRWTWSDNYLSHVWRPSPHRT